MSNDRPVFVVGCPRSGTTLLTAILHAHPRLAMPPENRFLLPAYRQRARFGDLRDAANRAELARWLTTWRPGRFSDLGLDPAAVVAEVVSGPPTLGSALGIVLRAFARSRGKARWGDKRPAYWKSLDVVLRLFPDAQIVNVVRDGRACVASLQQVSWWEGDLNSMISTWVQWDRETRRARQRLPADSYHEVRYEELVHDPRRALTALCSYLEEPFDERMLDHSRAARQIVPARKLWHARVGSGLDVDRLEAWRSSMDPAALALTELVAGRQLRNRGYELVGDAPRPTPRAVAGYYHEHARREASMRYRRLTDAWQRRRESGPLAAQLTTRQRRYAGLPPEPVDSGG